MERSKRDPCVFRLRKDGAKIMILCGYVNDIIVERESNVCDAL